MKGRIKQRINECLLWRCYSSCEEVPSLMNLRQADRWMFKSRRKPSADVWVSCEIFNFHNLQRAERGKAFIASDCVGLGRFLQFKIVVGPVTAPHIALSPVRVYKLSSSSWEIDRNDVQVLVARYLQTL